MKINLDVEELKRNRYKVEEVCEHFATQLAMEGVVKDGKVVIVDDQCDYSQVDLFDLGVQFGTEKERSNWTEPDVFHLANEYAELFKRAVSEYSKETYITVDSIKCNRDHHQTYSSCSLLQHI